MEGTTILRNPDPKYWENIVELAIKKESWIVSVASFKAYYAGFPEGNFTLFVAVVSETKEFIGSVCVATYTKPEPFSAIGLYVVRNEFQGRGIGSRLFEEAIKICAPKKFLYGAHKMMPKYRDKYRFDKIPNWSLTTARADLRKVKPLQLNHDPTLMIQSPAACGWDEINKYYQKFLPQLDCSQFVKALLCEENSHCGVAITNEKRIVALVRVREIPYGELSIGPLLGNDLIAASTVLRHVLSNITNLREFKSLSIQSPSSNSDTFDLLKQLTDSEYTIDKLKCYPQWTHEIFEIPVDHIYAISQSDISIV